MNWHDKIFIVAWLLLFMIVQARFQDKHFDDNKPAGKRWHFWQAVLYGVAMCMIIPYWVSCGWWIALKLAAIGVAERFAFFDGILNIARHRSFFYNGKGTTDSVIDQLENELSTFWVIVLKITYIVIFILAFIFIH